MSETKFSELEILPAIMQAIEEMGFETATDIQAQSIPAIKAGSDVIGRSQTGTGKTIAFGIPALEIIDTKEEKSTVQVMILCPTRELAQQACEEIKKLSQYLHGVRPVEVYGGVPMDRQIVRLKKANIVIGTPGRIMDHMRRKTIKVNHLKMIVLDEADEMLSMGFKEDIETILTDTPTDRQTVLFSATMPPAIMSITRQFQTSPVVIEIDRKHITLDNIEQMYIDAPMGRKMDALNLVLRFHNPNRTMIFCNTKKMVDEISEYLCDNGFQAEGLHGDMKQAQRTKVMDSFKAGKTNILVATDVAARGIDVNDIEYVINYDIPQNTEYYVHRIGRTGRAGKSGIAITLCSGRRQVYTVSDIARTVKSTINELKLPTLSDIQEKSRTSNIDIVEKALENEPKAPYVQMVSVLIEKGFSAEKIAAAALEMQFGESDRKLIELNEKAPQKAMIRNDRSDRPLNGTQAGYRKISINIGRASHVAPNHIVGAITEQTGINGSDVGKIEIFDERTVVGIPLAKFDQVLQAMVGCKICGKPTTSVALMDKDSDNFGGSFGGGFSGGRDDRSRKPAYRRSSKPNFSRKFDKNK